MGKATEIFGKNGSCKSNLCLKIIANAQKLFPDKKNVWLDFEGTFDPKWAKKFGVDVDALYYYRPDCGEDAIDIVEALLSSPECGVVIIDSLGAMTTTRELDNTAGKRDVGGPAFLVTALMRKVVAALSRAEKEGYSPTFIGINQVRSKIGAYGPDPMDTPGGHALKHLLACRIRLYGKEVNDAKYSKNLPIKCDVTFQIVKKKFPIVNTKGDFSMTLIPHKSLTVGDCDDFNLVKKYMEEHNVLTKDKTKFVFMGDQVFGTLKEIRAMFDDDNSLYQEVKDSIIEAEKEVANGEGYDPTTGEVYE